MAQWFHYNPHDPQCFAQRIAELQARPQLKEDRAFAPKIDHPYWVEAIAQQQVLWGNGDRAISAARSLASPNTYTVIAGQQTGLFGGPLYSQLKAVAAIKLADRLAKLFPDSTFVPVFWMASGDSDYEEVRRTFILNQAGEVVELALPPQVSGDNTILIASRQIRSEQVIALLGEELPGGEFRESVYAGVTADYNMGYIHHCFARWMARLFRDKGLVLVDPTHGELKEIAAGPLMVEELTRPAAVSDTLLTRNSSIKVAGFEPQVAWEREDTNVFHVDLFEQAHRSKLIWDEHGISFKSDGGPIPSGDGEIFDADHEADEQDHFESMAYSPGALLNPLYQDLLLRPVAFIGGAAELAYRAQSSALADLHGMKLAPAFLRATATLLPQKSADAIDELGWEVADFYRMRDEVLKAAVALDKPEEIQRALEGYFATIHAADIDLREAVIAFDPTLEESFETLRGNLIRHLDKLDKKITASLKQRGDTRVRRVSTVHNQVYPRNQVQERELSLLSFLPRYGFGLIDELLERLEFPSWEHQVVVV